jgi:hypothetical protein
VKTISFDEIEAIAARRHAESRPILTPLGLACVRVVRLE